MRSRLLVAALVLIALGLGAAPAGAAEISFYLGLRRPEAAARGAFFALSDPGSPSYRRFGGVGTVARRYGASAATVAGLRRAARGHRLRVRVDRSRVFARVSAPVARLERVFGVRITRSYDNDTLSWGWFVAGGRAPRLPRDLRPFVREVVASYGRSQRRTPRVRGTAAAARPAPPGNAGTWTDGCRAARVTGAYSFAQVRTAYGLDALGARPGAGGSVAIVNVGEGVVPQDVAVGGRCFGLPAITTRTLLADGQTRPFGRGTFEPQEDLALVRGMAPGLRSITFAQTWEAPELWFLAPAAVLAAPRLPDALSISYGECEAQIRDPRRAPAATRAGAALMDSVLTRLGLAGVAGFASAGDFGSTCNGQPFPGVAWPGSSSFLTSAGGSRLVLDAANQRADEVVWNDLAWLSTDDGGGAGGGGLSAVASRPPYQRGITAAGSEVQRAGVGRARLVPDLAAHASMLPGWPVSIATNWVQDGGTSASAPLLAGAFAALSARERAAGRPPLGPVNGLLYALARGETAAAQPPLFDVVSGDNSYSARVPGHAAAPGYDLASGLGVPRFDLLAAALPPPA